LRTLSRSSGSAIASGVSPARLRSGATSTPALLRRAIASLLRPPPAIGIEAKSCSEFRAEEVPMLILERPGRQLPPRLRQTKIWRSVASLWTRAKRLRRCRGEVIRHGHIAVQVRSFDVRGALGRDCGINPANGKASDVASFQTFSRARQARACPASRRRRAADCDR